MFNYMIRKCQKMGGLELLVELPPLTPSAVATCNGVYEYYGITPVIATYERLGAVIKILFE